VGRNYRLLRPLQFTDDLLKVVLHLFDFGQGLREPFWILGVASQILQWRDEAPKIKTYLAKLVGDADSEPMFQVSGKMMNGLADEETRVSVVRLRSLA